MKNKNLNNKYFEDFRELCIYIKDGFKNHLRSLSYPKEKMPMIGWIFYLSYLVANISMIMIIVSMFLFPPGFWWLFGVIGGMSAFICGSIAMTYEPK